MAITRQDYKIIHNTLPSNYAENNESFENLAPLLTTQNIRYNSSSPGIWNVNRDTEDAIKNGKATLYCNLDWNTSYVFHASDYVYTEKKNKISISNNEVFNGSTSLKSGGYVVKNNILVLNTDQFRDYRSTDLIPIDCIEEVLFSSLNNDYASLHFCRWENRVYNYSWMSSEEIESTVSHSRIKQLSPEGATHVGISIYKEDSLSIQHRKTFFEFDNYIFFHTGPKNAAGDEFAKVKIECYGVLFNLNLKNELTNKYVTGYYTSLKPKIYLFKSSESKIVNDNKNSLVKYFSYLHSFEPFPSQPASIVETYDSFAYLFKRQPTMDIITKDEKTGIRLHTQPLSSQEQERWMILENGSENNPYKLSIFRDHLIDGEQSVKSYSYGRRQVKYRYGKLRYLFKTYSNTKIFKDVSVSLLDDGSLGVEFLWDPSVNVILDGAIAQPDEYLNYFVKFSKNFPYENARGFLNKYNFTSFAFNWSSNDINTGIMTNPLIISREIIPSDGVEIEYREIGDYYREPHIEMTKKTT